MTVDEISDVYRRVCGVSTRVTLTAPIDAFDAETLRAALAAAVPELTVAVHLASTTRALATVTDPGGRRIYAREFGARQP